MSLDRWRQALRIADDDLPVLRPALLDPLVLLAKGESVQAVVGESASLFRVGRALGMRAGLEEYNRELEAEGLPRLALGVGLHRGSGVAGLVGSKELMEFTVVGRTINVAARVQDLTRRHDTDILLTEEVKKALDPRFVLEPLEPTEVRGIAEPIMIYAARGFGQEGTS